ncbi:TetR/AcrR family transcriptional regulator ['Paenibacillus yunnanensis' Narsing Rao et al. 2020]|uniref:TetR/AcrR family transcriptional regulator n=1 Tax=Paenibacillus tengchongensis TaxID=2608684 RepID=UPI00124C46E2|nr:TetR/AcrR family transcriptional regulator [Paenibacillus tengchongensis]
MKETGAAGVPEEEQWMKELLALSETEEQMTPRQLAIVQAAIEIFSEKGYSAASTNEIARKAGVAEGTIFRYYKTKKDLLLSIVGGTMSRMLAPFVLSKFNGLLDEPGGSCEEFLRALIRNRLDFSREHIKILRIFIQEVPFQPALREQFVKNVLDQVLERLTAITGHYKAKGEIIDAPTPALLRFTISAVIGYLLTRLIFIPDHEWDDEQEIDLTVNFILHGIGGPQGKNATGDSSGQI